MPRHSPVPTCQVCCHHSFSSPGSTNFFSLCPACQKLAKLAAWLSHAWERCQAAQPQNQQELSAPSRFAFLKLVGEQGHTCSYHMLAACFHGKASWREHPSSKQQRTRCRIPGRQTGKAGDDANKHPDPPSAHSLLPCKTPRFWSALQHRRVLERD